MDKAVVDLNWLCNWLEENSSGVYRPAKDAAHVIRTMQAEIEALRTELQQLREQEPVAYGIPNSAITGKSQPMMTLHHERCGQYPELMVPLYAAPVPAMPIPKQDDVPLFYGNTITGDATVRINGVGEFICKSAHSDAIPKQEPAVAVPDDVIAKTINDLRDVAVKYHGAQQLREQIAAIIRPMLKSSPRITEQDAREILISGFICHGFVNAVDYVDSWLLREGRALLNKLNANAVAEVRQEPAEKILTDIKDQQKNAWLAVCKALDEVKPDWLAHGKKGIDCAVEAIRSLSQPAQAAAIPEQKTVTYFLATRCGFNDGSGTETLQSGTADWKGENNPKEVFVQMMEVHKTKARDEYKNPNWEKVVATSFSIVSF